MEYAAKVYNDRLLYFCIARMKTSYKDAGGAWSDFNELVVKLICANDCKIIGEIGGGANPLLQENFIREQKLNYTVLDISQDELTKAGDYYTKQQIDFEKEDILGAGMYDLLFAQMTLEHINKPAAFYKNVHQLLKPGGYALFFFACDTMLPTRINKLLPDKWSDKLLMKLQPFRQQEKHGKFKAYYRWCKGPTKKNIQRLQSTGLHILSYAGYFGHSYYQRVPILQSLEKWKTKILLCHPVAGFCSYSIILLQKPLT